MSQSPKQKKEPQESQFTRSIELVAKYLAQFGFSNYEAIVEPLPKEHYGKCWAATQWSIDDEWVIFYFMPDGALPDAVQELTVIHEVAHGLIEMGNFGSGAIEQACWRVARAFLPNVDSPQAWLHKQLEPGERLEASFRSAEDE